MILTAIVIAMLQEFSWLILLGFGLCGSFGCSVIVPYFMCGVPGDYCKYSNNISELSWRRKQVEKENKKEKIAEEFLNNYNRDALEYS